MQSARENCLKSSAAFVIGATALVMTAIAYPFWKVDDLIHRRVDHLMAVANDCLDGAPFNARAVAGLAFCAVFWGVVVGAIEWLVIR